uniref:G2 and S-phase expressed 1 n=1 Tax=Ursus americanus TaxID=9643 RepID=A0A452SIY8_URSAM
MWDVKVDILLLADEKFDFDLSLSSSSANEDDEVFFGPVGHKERCVAASLELNHHIPEEPLLPASESHFTWSPLTGEKFVEVYKEAHLLALQIERKSKDKAAQDGTAEDLWSQGVERFIQESKLKISLFEKENEMKKSPKSLKRETYYLSDSPLRGPPLLGTQTPAGVALPSAPARTQGPPHSPRSSLPVEPRTAHPPDQAGTQRKVISKLVRPRAVSVRGKNIHVAMEQIMNSLMTPVFVFVFYNILFQLGLKKTLLKPAGYAGGLSRKSSSSGSVSAVISSTCASPAASRARSSEPTSISAGSSPPLSNSSPSGRTGPATPWQTLQAGPAGTSCWESRWATAAKVMAEPAKAPTPAALDGAPTPERGGPGLSSGSAWSQSCQLSTAWNARRNSSLLCRTRAVPTPTSQFKVPKFATGEPPDSATPKSCRAQRPQSCTSAGRVIVHSTPARRSSVAAPQSLVSSTRTPIITKHVSALPTPASRRLSGLPLVTPKTMPRALASPLCLSARRLSSEPRKKSSVRAAPTRGGNSKAASRCEDSSPDGPFSPPSAVPQALHFSPEKSDLTFSRGISTEVELDAAPPPGDTSASEVLAILVDIKLDQLAITPKVESTALIDVPLIDFCNSPEAHLAVGSESRPLIDLLINTPDMKRSTASKPAQEVGQLIDLASPLIQLSPEADKENMDSPLLKF